MQPDENTREPLEVQEFLPQAVEQSEIRRTAQTVVPQHRPPVQFRSRKHLAIFLFVATCLSTFFVGMAITNPRQADRFQIYLVNGFKYSGSLMLILLAHEMGHYLQARRYGVPATLPFFIPMPIMPFGTMGAVIIQAAGVADRKSLFDIAITGPLAGLVVALPITYIGLQDAAFVPRNAAGLIYGDPLILQWMIDYVHGPRPEGQEVLLNPVLFAGWVGIFITALNLIPIGQLDGGHLLYTLIGKRSHFVAVVLLGLAVAYMILSHYYAYGLMVLLLLLMGPKHPPTANDQVPLGVGRIILGWLTLAFIIIGFTPQPIVANF